MKRVLIFAALAEAATGAALRDFPRVFAAQMLYPFRKMLRTDG
jgi:hypothetical protein